MPRYLDNMTCWLYIEYGIRECVPMSKSTWQSLKNVDASVVLAAVLLVAASWLLVSVKLTLGLGVVVGLAPAIPLVIRLAMSPPEPTDAVERAERLVGCAPVSRRLWLLLYTSVVLLMSVAITASWVLKNFDLGTVARLTVALLPVPAFILFILAEVQVLSRVDELQRRIQLEALAIAFPSAVVMGVALEYLQKAGFVTAWTIGDFWPLIGALYLPAYLIARWRYS